MEKTEKDSSKWEKPDLLVIDGGKGQLSSVGAILEELNITGIDLISLAKEKANEKRRIKTKFFCRDVKIPFFSDVILDFFIFSCELATKRIVLRLPIIENYALKFLPEA